MTISSLFLPSLDNIEEQQQLAISIMNPATESKFVDTTSRKVVVYNIHKFTKDYELKKLVAHWTNDIDVEVTRTKKPPKKNWVVLTLANDDMVQPLLDKLNDGKHINKKGGVLRAARAAERFEKRGRDGDDGSGNDKKRQRREDYVKTPDELRDAVTPLWKMSYEDQAILKTRSMINKCIQRIIKEIKAKIRVLQRDKQRKSSQKKFDDSKLYDWLKQKVNFNEIIQAPKHFKYRNKSELTFGYRHTFSEEESIEGAKADKVSNDLQEKESEEEGETQQDTNDKKIVKTPAVGFMAGGWAGGVSSPHHAANIPDIVCGIADVINKFLAESPIPVYTALDHRGVWRTITIRSSDRTQQCMIVICHAPPTGGAGAKTDGSDDYSAVFDGEKERLIKMLTDSIPMPKREFAGPGTSALQNKEDKAHCDYKVSSIFFQEFDGLSNPSPEHPVQHLYGEKFIEEKLLQCTFQISPGAFFQVTTEGAEVLYQVVIDKLKEVTSNPNETLLFDVCCGTGTIGLSCLKEGAVGKVVGIDISEPAIKDAIINAEKNGYAGTEGCTKFVASRAEKAMYNEIKAAGKDMKHMIAIVDPAREGLHKDVCKALRNEKRINRIIYVSCNPTGSLTNDAASLCTPETKKFSGIPFKITSAQPVDMFPLTDHCEMVMVFDRMSEDELNLKEDEATTKEALEGITTSDVSKEESVEGTSVQNEENEADTAPSEK